jgi:hypothetical protein
MKNSTLATLALLACAAAPSTEAQVKWHPGHYVKLNAGGTQAEHFRHIDEVGREPVLKGVELYVWWYEIERSKGVYDFSRIDAILGKLKSLPVRKQLVVRVMDRRFGTTSKTAIVPNYLLNEPIYKGGVAFQDVNMAGYVARLWEAPVMDRLIALYRALGMRYDPNPYVEGFATEETTLSISVNKSTTPAGYSAASLLKQYLRFAAAARQTMPHSNIFMGTNFIGGEANMGTLIQALHDSDLAAGGPSTIPNRLLESQKVWTGVTGADYRGAIAIGPGVETAVFGGKHGNYSPKQVADWAYQNLGVTHLFWVRNTWTGSDAQRWSTGILPTLRTNPPTRTACPRVYGLCAK